MLLQACGNTGKIRSGESESCRAAGVWERGDGRGRFAFAAGVLPRRLFSLWAWGTTVSAKRLSGVSASVGPIAHTAGLQRPRRPR